MTGRERVQKAIHHKSPDRVPIMHMTLIGAKLAYGEGLERLYRRYPADILSLAFTESEEYDSRAGAGIVDSWGSRWIRLDDNYKGQVVDHPLTDWKALDTYRFPNPLATEEFAQAKDHLSAHGEDRYVLVDGGTLFQRMFYLRDLDKLLIDLVERDERALFLRDRILEHILGRVRAWSEVGVDGVSIRDDWGAQDRLIISPDLWREVFKPSYKTICRTIHQLGLNAHIHTDGYTLQIIPDLIEVGFDEINPQHSVMDMDRLQEIMGGRVCLRTDIDRQRLLPYGSPEEVRRSVQAIIERWRPHSGGLVGSGQVSSDVPLENAEAMLAAFWES